MAADQLPLLDMKKICEQRGRAALKKARNDILLNCRDDSNISQALEHFSKVTLRGVLPVFPTLISLSCEAVGGESKKEVPFSASIILITGAADLHDDVIDQSTTKGPKQTVFGKFGTSTSILAGDILLSQGIAQLRASSEMLSKEQRSLIEKLVADAILEISTAQDFEAQLKGRFDLPPDPYHEIIRLKAVVPELTMKIGAIVGNADSEDIELFGEFGRTYGVLSIIAEEFSDLLDINVLKNRIVNECVPLPVIYALQDQQTKELLLPLLNSDKLTERSHEAIAQIVIRSSHVQSLRKTLMKSATVEMKKLSKIKMRKIREELNILFSAPLKFMEFITS